MSNSRDAEYVFVYGTLRVGQPNHWLVDEWDATTVAGAHAPGLSLYLPAHRGYPYAVESATGLGVIGDLVAIPSRDWPRARRQLDQLEGYDPRSEATSHYLRTRTQVHDGNQVVTAWVYVAGPRMGERVRRMRHLPSGVWPPTQPAPGALLINPTTQTSLHDLGSDPAAVIGQLLGGEADAPEECADGTLLWTRVEAVRDASCDPNPVASFAPRVDGHVLLVFGPAIVTGRDAQSGPCDLTSAQAEVLVERCAELAARPSIARAVEMACAVRREWAS